MILTKKFFDPSKYAYHVWCGKAYYDTSQRDVEFVEAPSAAGLVDVQGIIVDSDKYIASSQITTIERVGEMQKSKTKNNNTSGADSALES